MAISNETQFDRSVILQIGDREYEGLRISFEVKKTIKSSLNEATIKAYNLPETYVSELQKDRLFVELKAGYDTPTLIFRGNPVEDGVSKNRKQGDFIVEVEASDGLKEYQSSRVNLSIGEATSIADVLDRVLDATAWTEGFIEVPDDAQLTQGVVLHGSARKILDRLAASQNADWSIQSSQLYFVPEGDYGDVGPVFSPDDKNILELREKDKGRIEIKSLLTPLDPGERFKIEDTDGFDGTYKARAVEHKGDSGYSSEFYTTIVGE